MRIDIILGRERVSFIEDTASRTSGPWKMWAGMTNSTVYACQSWTLESTRVKKRLMNSALRSVTSEACRRLSHCLQAASMTLTKVLLLCSC